MRMNKQYTIFFLFRNLKFWAQIIIGCQIPVLFFTASSFASSAQSKDNTIRKIVISDILIQGNRKTSSSIILRELTFKKGDTIVASFWHNLSQRSEENLRNTSLFTTMPLVDTVRMKNGETDVFIQVQERWYIWPAPIFKVEERNFNTWWQQDNHRFDKADLGGTLSIYNVLGMNQTIGLIAQLGYTKELGFSYKIPYINKKQAGGLALSFNYTENNELPYTSVNDILTYLDYPGQILQRTYKGKIQYTYRQGLYITHILEADIYSSRIADTIKALTKDYLPFNVSSAVFPEVKYYFKSDFRDCAPYPLRGYFFDISMNEYGMGMKLNNQSFNMFYVQSSFHKYWALSRLFYYSAEAEGKISQSGAQPYFLQRALGYSNSYVRGYELYVDDGNNYGLLKNEVRFRLINRPVQTIPYLGMSQFNTTYFSIYLAAFSDLGYVGAADPYVTGNFLANTPLWGNGIGIDLVTYYDLVFRLEYSVNNLGQGGVFLHFTAPM